MKTNGSNKHQCLAYSRHSIYIAGTRECVRDKYESKENQNVVLRSRQKITNRSPKKKRTNGNQTGKWYKPLLLSLLLRQNMQKCNVRKKGCVVPVGCLLVWAQSFRVLSTSRERDGCYSLAHFFLCIQSVAQPGRECQPSLG